MEMRERERGGDDRRAAKMADAAIFPANMAAALFYFRLVFSKNWGFGGRLGLFECTFQGVFGGSWILTDFRLGKGFGHF